MRLNDDRSECHRSRKAKSMSDVTVILSPEPAQTRILTTIYDNEVLKAALPEIERAHPRALPTLLEGLALWTQRRLSVVLVADEAATSSCGATFEVLAETPSLHYEVGVAVRDRRRRLRQTIGGVASFRDLQCFRQRAAR